MGIEQKVNYQLNKYPRLKKVVKSVYQHSMYAISTKVKCEGDVKRVSPKDDCHEYFFGYYDKSPWDATERYMLCLRANDTWSDVSPKEKADILLIDMAMPQNKSGRVRKIAETSAWNVQQASMLQWLGPDFSANILFNDCRDGKFVSVIKNIWNDKEIVIEAPVYSVSSDGKRALTLDFSRLYNLRPGYGYYNVPEKTKGISLPDSTAVWKINLENGEVSELLSYKDFASFQPRPEMLDKKAVHKVNHLMISPNGKRFMVLYRWFVGERKYSRLMTCNLDGSDLYVLSDDDMVSHCFWKDDEHILAFENKKGQGPGYYLMTDKTQIFRRCWPELTSDGHPSYDRKYGRIVTDSYPDRTRMQFLKCMEDEDGKPETIAKVFAPFKYDNDVRCDLHPRWNHNGDKICFDGAFEGHRGLYMVDCPRKIQNRAWKEKISIVIPVYNTEKYLERCVESVMHQTYHNLEVILVNDGSTDGSLEICRKLRNKYPDIILINKKNGGLGSARNAGIQASHGDYVAFLDSDDWVTCDCYEYMLKIALQYRADLSDVRVYQVKAEQDAVPVFNEKIQCYRGNNILRHYLFRGMNEQNGAPFSACRKLYNRSLFQGETACFSEETVNEDICFNYLILRKCKKIVVSNQIKYLYFQGMASITNGAMKKKDMELLAVSRELVKLAEESKDSKIIELAKMKEARSFFSLLARAAKDGIDEKSIEDADILIKKLRRGLKKNLGLLLKSPMPFLRKALALAFTINYGLSCKMIKVLRF